MPDVNTCQTKPLESIYPFVFMDTIHYKRKPSNRNKGSLCCPWKEIKIFLVSGSENMKVHHV